MLNTIYKFSVVIKDKDKFLMSVNPILWTNISAAAKPFVTDKYARNIIANQLSDKCNVYCAYIPMY
jgi:hypothetical protein